MLTSNTNPYLTLTIMQRYLKPKPKGKVWKVMKKEKKKGEVAKVRVEP